MTYTVTAIIGFAMSTVYGSGVSITAKVKIFFVYDSLVCFQRMNVSDSYMWVFFFAAQLLPMMNPVLCSFLMEQDMENFVYMNITSTLLGLICLPLVVYVYRNLRSKGVLKDKGSKNKTILYQLK